MPQMSHQVLLHLSRYLIESLLFFGDNPLVRAPDNCQVEVVLHLQPFLEHLQRNLFLLDRKQSLADVPDCPKLVLFGSYDL